MKLDDAIENRRSVRKFRSKDVKWENILDAIYAALQAPFAGNLADIQFIIIKDQEKKNQLFEATQQEAVSEAPYLIAVISDYRNLERLYFERTEMYARQQVGAAIENFLLKITDMKLSACWIGAFTDDKVKRILEIPKEMNIEALIPVGHARLPTKKPKKPSLENSIHWEKYGMRRKPTSREKRLNKV